MREISLITGQLHRAIYNLNEEARRTANQKFESGLPAAPERSLRKAFDQFRESLEQGDSTVRRRTASLLVTLIRSFEAIPATLQPEILQMIDLGLADDDPLVREATVESYSMLLENISEPKSVVRSPEAEGSPSNDPANEALTRILTIAISDPDEIVREAAAVGVAVQKSEAVQKFGVEFLLDHVQDHRHRHACRSVASLAEFPDQQSLYIDRLNAYLNDSDWRFRRAALFATLRLAKLEALPRSLLCNVTRRLFDSEKKVAAAADNVVEVALGAIGRANASVAEFLTECRWLATQADCENHLRAILETELVSNNVAECLRICGDRVEWHLQKRSGDVSPVPMTDVDNAEALANMVDHLARLNQRSAVGWVAGAIVGLAEKR